MFTEGLDEKALSWINQGLNVKEKADSPIFSERFSLGSHTDPSLLLNKKREFLLSPVLPPLRFHSGLLGAHRDTTIGFEDDGESVASAPDDAELEYSDPFDEGALGSSDSELQENEATTSRDDEDSFGTNFDKSQRFVGLNPRIGEGKSVSASEERNSRESTDTTHAEGSTPQIRPEIGTPSAPPMIETGNHRSIHETTDDIPSSQGITGQVYGHLQTQPSASNFDAPKGGEVYFDSNKESFNHEATCPRQMDAPRARESSIGAGVQVPSRQTASVDRAPIYSTSGQSAWQTLVAYEACTRLCLQAWARGCMEAPEFLRDECIALRNAFGLQKFLLQPQIELLREERSDATMEETCTVKAKKVVAKIKVEVKKIRIVPHYPRQRLQATNSQWGLPYMQVGAQYVRQVSAQLKSRMYSLKAVPFAGISHDAFSCMLQLKSASDETQLEPGSAISMQPGSGESYVFFPESQADALLVEVRDSKGGIQGRSVIQVSLLNDNLNDRVRWWPIYDDDSECVGKVQLAISCTNTSCETSSVKCGPVSETFAYDLVLEAAMRSQHFHSRNLRLYGPWKWLLTEFAEYYGVSDSYTKLRYLSYVMDVAMPTKDCLELAYELLVPVIKARNENNLNRQEKRILFDCEAQVGRLLTTVFENYKSLDDLSPTGLASDLFGPSSDSAAPALAPAVQIYALLHDVLSLEAQNILRTYLQTAARKRCKRHMLETDEYMSANADGFLTDMETMTTAYRKMKTLCINISSEIYKDIKIHNQHIFPSSIDLPNIAAAVYSTELCNRLRGFLVACPPSGPSPHVTELLLATADFEGSLFSWNISPINGGVDSKNLFHHYIVLWIQDKQDYLIDLCKGDKAPLCGITTQNSTSPFVEDMYEHIKAMLDEYKVVINRWPQYSLLLESAIADVERATMKALEKQFNEILMPLKDSIQKKLGMQVQKFTRRQSVSHYIVPNQLGTFLNTVKRILDILHCKIESILKSWASFLPGVEERRAGVVGEQLNGITVMLRTKYKNYLQALVEKLVRNTEANRSIRLKKILEETKEAEGEAEIRERMQPLSLQLAEIISNLHDVFSSRIFVAICRGFWDRMGQCILSFLESKKENRIWYKGSYYALVILDDTFASQMQRLQGNSLQDKDLDPPRSVIESRSILCRDTQNAAERSNYYYF
ncbi:uncharacterized protein LOC116259141 [Nymphaea colorata]|nr:uncharacterized protein LOC116259141 [Nymphaea colorata]